MADDSPGKVQALRAIFSEKNKPVMGIMPPGGKIPNRPWKSAIEPNDEPTPLKERSTPEQKFPQPITKVLPPVDRKSNEIISNGDSHKETNGFISEKAPKPSVGPKPNYLSQQVRNNNTHQDNNSCDTTKNEDNNTNRTRNSDGHSLLKSQAKSKAVAETIASFMFTNGYHQKTTTPTTHTPNVPNEDKNKNSKSPPPVPLPRNSQSHQHQLLQTELLKNLCNSQNSEKLCKSESEALIINSDNYICKSNCNFRRKELPSLETLGQAPLKPTRPPQVVLPEKYRKLSKVSAHPLNTPSLPPLTSPPAIPQRPAPQRPSYPCPPRPHTPPPLPPVTRTSLSLREEIEELYEDTVLEEHKRPVSLIPEYTAEEEAAEELYNDAEPSEESLLAPPPLKPRERPPPCPSEYLQPNVHNSTEELYQDADEVNDDEFYEVMPCDADEYSEDPGSPVYSNNKKEVERLRREEEKKLRKEQKEREKREKEMEKLKRKFGLTGDEIPIDDGLVKADSRGNRSGDLPVKRGETVLILRMEGNPQGRWLVKNEKGKIGYVELTNIEVDPQSVKSVMTIRRFSVISTSEELYSEARSEEEGIYEVTY